MFTFLHETSGLNWLAVEMKTRVFVLQKFIKNPGHSALFPESPEGLIQQDSELLLHIGSQCIEVINCIQ